MKKNVMLLAFVLGIFIFSFANVSASISYSEGNQTYEIDTWIPSWLGGEGYSNVTLLKNTDQCLINCGFEIQGYNDEEVQLIDDISFVDKNGNDVSPGLKEINFEIGTYQYVTKFNETYENICENSTGENITQNCEKNLISNETYQELELIWNKYQNEKVSGYYLLKANAKKDKSLQTDWIIEFRGKELTEWAWWDSNWKYKKEITITENSGNSLINYSTLIYIPYTSNMKTDFSDLRFLNSAENTELGYWIENKSDSNYAWIWIKIPTLTASLNTSIYMYYGNSLASSNSNGENAFLKYITDYTSWTGGTGSSSGLTMTGTEIYSYLNYNFPTNNYAIRTYWKVKDSLPSVTLRATDTDNFYTNPGNGMYKRVSGSWTLLTNILNWDVGDETEFAIEGNNLYHYINNDLKNQSTDSSITTNGTKILYRQATSGTATINRTIIRVFTATIPTNLIGDEMDINGLIIELNLPIDNYNSSSSNITFSCNAYEAAGVLQLNLTIDGVVNQTVTNSTPGENLSISEILSFSEGNYTWGCSAYNSEASATSANRTFEVLFSSPSINLTSPIDVYNATSPSIDFEFDVTDAYGVENVSLFLDGVLNETNSSGVNGTYYFTKSFSEGEHNWSVQSYSIIDKLTTSDTRTFNLTFSNPVVNLTSPADDYESTSDSITFEFTATDDNGISVVTLYINDILNQTNSSGVNGSYSFTSNLGDGDYNWSVAADSILSKTTLSDTRTLSVDANGPSITLTAPPSVFDYLIEGDTLNLNWSVSDDNLDECWHTYYQNDSNVFSGISGVSLLFDGDYITTGFNTGYFYVDDYINELILARYWDSVDCSGIPALYYSEMDISLCASDEEKIRINITYNGTTRVYNISCNDSVLYTQTLPEFSACGYPAPVEIFVNKTFLNCSANTTTFNYIQGENEVTFFATDTYGNIANETRNWTSLIGTFSIDYENPVYEGYENTITATIEGISETSSLTSAILHYNGNNYSTSIIYDDGDYEISATLSAPAVTTDTNYTFGFYLTIDGEIYDPQQNNQTVLNANFGECGGVSNDTILTLNLVDEDSQESILGDIEIGGTIKSVSSGETIGTIYILVNNTNSTELCFSPPTAYDLYYMDAEIRYTADGYSSELYYLQNADITDDLGNLTLYDLNESKSTTFKVTYQDSSYNFVEEAIVQLQRKYISEGIYKTVEAPLTSYEGVSNLHINLDSILYRATVVKDGVVLDEFDNIIFNCQSELTGECEHKLLGEIDPDNEEDLDDTRDFHYSQPVLDNDSISVSFSIPSGSPSSVNIVLEQKDQFGNKTLCNKTITSSAGAMSCAYDEVLGISYIDFTIFKDGLAMSKQSYVVEQSDYLDWLGNNYIFIFVLLLSLVGMALTSPEWIIVNGILTMVISGGLYLARGLDFVVGLGSIVWLVIAAIILISKMAKQEDR